jgi:hypothetical protein
LSWRIEEQVLFLGQFAPTQGFAAKHAAELGFLLEELGRLEHHLGVVEAEQPAAGQGLKADDLAGIGGHNRLVVRHDDLVVDELIELGDCQGQVAHVLGRRGDRHPRLLLVVQAKDDRPELQEIAHYDHVRSLQPPPVDESAVAAVQIG